MFSDKGHNSPLTEAGWFLFVGVVGVVLGGGRVWLAMERHMWDLSSLIRD